MPQAMRIRRKFIYWPKTYLLKFLCDMEHYRDPQLFLTLSLIRRCKNIFRSSTKISWVFVGESLVIEKTNQQMSVFLKIFKNISVKGPIIISMSINTVPINQKNNLYLWNRDYSKLKSHNGIDLNLVFTI